MIVQKRRLPSFLQVNCPLKEILDIILIFVVMWRIAEQVSAILDAIPCFQGVVHDDKPPPDLCWVSIEMQSFLRLSRQCISCRQSEKQSFFKPGNVREV